MNGDPKVVAIAEPAKDLDHTDDNKELAAVLMQFVTMGEAKSMRLTLNYDLGDVPSECNFSLVLQHSITPLEARLYKHARKFELVQLLPGSQVGKHPTGNYVIYALPTLSIHFPLPKHLKCTARLVSHHADLAGRYECTT